MNYCGCSPGEVCDVCDPAGVDAAIAAGHIAMDIDMEEPDYDQNAADAFMAEVEAQAHGDQLRAAGERALMHDAMMEDVASSRGVEIDALDGYFDAENNWVDLGTPERRGTMGRPGSDKRHRGN